MINPLLAEGLARYLDHGIPTGSFLQAVLSNDLFDAFQRADHENQHNMLGVVQYIYDNLPIGAYGSPGSYTEWIKMDPGERQEIVGHFKSSRA